MPKLVVFRRCARRIKLLGLQAAGENEVLELMINVAVGASMPAQPIISERMWGEGRLLVIETLVGTANEPSWGKLQDLSMLITTGGMERTEKEFSNILSQAGLLILQTLSTPSDLAIIVAKRS